MAMQQLERHCVWCHKNYLLELDEEKVRWWEAGAHVQNVWPELSVGDREMIISGTHSACFDEMFKDDD